MRQRDGDGVAGWDGPGDGDGKRGDAGWVLTEKPIDSLMVWVRGVRCLGVADYAG